MKKILGILCFAIFFLLHITSQSYVDDFGDFTFVIPDNWVSIHYTGLKYNVLCGRKHDDFRQNIIIVSEKYDGDFKTYINELNKNLNYIIPDCQIVKITNFENETNLDSVKVTLKRTSDSKQVRQYCYIYKKEADVFLCLCSVLDKETEEIETVFDNSMKTFQVLDKNNTL